MQHIDFGPENLKEILDMTWNYRARWKFIGIELGIDEGTLDAIDKDNRKVDDCLREMIKYWLRLGRRPKPSRRAISRALESRRVSSTAGNCLIVPIFVCRYLCKLLSRLGLLISK